MENIEQTQEIVTEDNNKKQKFSFKEFWKYNYGFIIPLTLHLILLLCAIITKANQALELNWFQFYMRAPYYEAIEIINRIIPSYSVNYVLAFIITGSYTMLFSLTGTKYAKDLFVVSAQMIAVYKDKSTEAYEHVEKMLNIKKEHHMNLIKNVLAVIGVIMFVYFFGCFMGYFLFNENITRTEAEYNLLWFNLKTGESIPVLFIIYCVLSALNVIVPLVKTFFANKNDENYKHKTNMAIYQSLLKAGTIVLILFAVKNNVLFAIFINFSILKSYFKQFRLYLKSRQLKK